MKKRIVLVVVLAVLIAASANAQTTDLFTLVQVGTPQDVQAAIEKGADVNAHTSRGTGARSSFGGDTPLILAAKDNENPEMITTLLKAGANIEARDLVYGGTALTWAAERNRNPEVIARLLKAGADVNAQDTQNGRTAVTWAAYGGVNPAEVVIVLLNGGADAKVKDKRGKTAFDYAQGNYRLKGTDALKKLEEASK